MGTRHLLWFAVGVFAVISAVGASGRDEKKDEAVKAELKRLAGEWEIVAAEQGGETVGSNDVVAFTGAKCTITNSKTKLVLENTITINPAKDPKWMDVTNTKTKQTWQGIYELKGDTLRAVFQGDKDRKRPTEFKTRKMSLEVMYTYQRVKPK